MNKEDRLEKLNMVFSPTAPIKEKDFFHGRLNQLKKTVEAINERGQHVILYGERGVGKTSLANIMNTSITNLYPVKVTCSRTDTFTSIWKTALGQVKLSKTTEGIGFKPQQKDIITELEDELENIEELNPSKIFMLVSRIKSKHLLFIFDEFDNITNKKSRELFADVIKSFSDNITNSTIVIVGIADNVDALIGNHQSLERCLKQIKMPRMSEEEMIDIIDKGLQVLEIRIPEQIKKSIVDFSSGFPHYVHLLCKYGAKEIIENDKNDFSDSYLTIAVSKGIDNTNEQLRSSYRKATLSAKIFSKWQWVLYACALADSDEYNCFKTGDVLKVYNSITRKAVKGSNITYNLNQLCTKERGEVIVKIGIGINSRYRFCNPMMRAFVKLKIRNKK